MRRIGLRYLNSYTSDDVTARLSSYRKLVVVRHPLTRLVSAYEDKVARVNPYGEKIRRKIIAMTSSSDAKTSTTHFRRITFADFVR